jgi:hypothetical protein
MGLLWVSFMMYFSLAVPSKERKKREIPMSVFWTGSSSGEPSSTSGCGSASNEPGSANEPGSNIPITNSETPKPSAIRRLSSKEAETPFNSKDSFDANTSQGTEDLESSNGAGSSLEYSKVAAADLPSPEGTRADQPTTSIWPKLNDEFKVDILPGKARSVTDDRSNGKEVEGQVYRSCGPRGQLS